MTFNNPLKVIYYTWLCRKLDDTLHSGVAIDLRTHEEKILIETWKEKYIESESADHENDLSDDSHEKNHH